MTEDWPTESNCRRVTGAIMSDVPAENKTYYCGSARYLDLVTCFRHSSQWEATSAEGRRDVANEREACLALIDEMLRRGSVGSVISRAEVVAVKDAICARGVK